jgi:hypothetical protein
MQFTRQETKLVERLRKEERCWPYLRWAVLAIGAMSTVVCTGWGYFLYKLAHEDNGGHLDPSDVFIIALLWTKCCMWFLIGTWSFLTAFVKWHGDVNRMLLLRLLDAQQKQTATDERAVKPPKD